MNSNDIISVYEAILAVTGEMLNAARSAEWDRLIERERACRVLVEWLKQQPEISLHDPAVRERRAEIIRKVLADDAEIRNITEPQIAKLSTLLETHRCERNVRSAYGGAG